MAGKFSKIAQENTLLSPIMVDREKMETKDVLDKEFTIIGFDFAPKFDEHGSPIIDDATGEVETFGVVIFKEEPKKYYCVGTVFTKVCKAWCSGYDSPYDASRDLAAEGGVKVRFKASKTKKGNNLTSVEILS